MYIYYVWNKKVVKRFQSFGNVSSNFFFSFKILKYRKILIKLQNLFEEKKNLKEKTISRLKLANQIIAIFFRKFSVYFCSKIIPDPLISITISLTVCL